MSPAHATYPPVVVLLGGPSAEHDVSVVSGTAIAAALLDADLDVRQVLIDLDGGWWWLPVDHRRDDRPAVDYDDPHELGAGGPAPARGRARPARCRAAGAGGVHRAARAVRRGRHRPGPARGGGPRLHRRRRGGVRARHEQGRPEADLARPGPAGRGLDRGPGRRLGRESRRRARPSSTRSPPARRARIRG